MNIIITELFYLIKPIIPRSMQLFLRRMIVKKKREKYKDVWPINKHYSNESEEFVEWPNGKQFAFVVTHDVESEKGYMRCKELVLIEKKMGFLSSFNFVPEKYKLSPDFRKFLKENGFEIVVHGLKHDGKLYASKKEFLKRARLINQYLEKWEAVGFRSPAMHHNFEWLLNLNIEYDSSTFDNDPFEPQPDGVNKIFPFYIKSNIYSRGYIELPYTLPQDFTLYVIMREKNIDIWKKKLDWIAEQGGMALVNVHPDYINFDGKKGGYEDYPIKYYVEFLDYVKDNYADKYWHALPKEVALFWKSLIHQK